MKIFIVIPIHNEEKHIVTLLKGLNKYKLPVVVVDDGSTDSTKILILKSRIRNLVYLEHKINLGKGAAMKTGADFAFAKSADAIIFMDSDGQHAPEDVERFIKAIKSGKSDIIFGSRNLSYGVPLVRYLGNKFASIILRAFFGVYISDSLCGFRAVTKKGYEKLRWDSAGYGVEVEMVARTGKKKVRFSEVPVETIYHDREKGVTILDAFGIMVSVLKWRLSL